MTTLSVGQTLKKGALLFMVALFISFSEEFSFRTSVQAATKCSPGAIHPCKMYPDLCAAGNGLCVFKSPCEYECKCPPLWTRHRTCVGVGGASGSMGSGSNSNSNTGSGSVFSEPVGSLVDSLLINPPDLFWDINHVSKPGESLSMSPTTTIAPVVATTQTSSATEAPSPTRAATMSTTSTSISVTTTQQLQVSTESNTKQRPVSTNTKMITTKAPQNSRIVDSQQSSHPTGTTGSQIGSVEVTSTNGQSAASKQPGSATNDHSPSREANPLSSSSLSSLLDPPSSPPSASAAQSRHNTVLGTGRTSAILSTITTQRGSLGSGGRSPQASQNLRGTAVSVSKDQAAQNSSNIEAIIANARDSVQSLANPETTSHGSSMVATSSESLPPLATDSLSSASSTAATAAKAAKQTTSPKETVIASQQPSLHTISNSNDVLTRQATKNQPSFPSESSNAAANINIITTVIPTTTVQTIASQSTATLALLLNTHTKTTASESTTKNMPTSRHQDHPSLFEHQDSFPTLFSEVPNPPASGDPQNAPLSTVIHRVFHPLGGLRFKVKR